MSDDKKTVGDYETNNFTMPEELVEAMLSIGEMTDDIVRAIPEAEFRKRYLPLFVSTEQNVDLSPWLDVCGTAYESVNVVKDGRVIFVVPPLVKRHPTHINVDSRLSAPVIVREAKQYEQRHPAQGQAHLVKYLSTKLVEDGVNPEEVKQWNQILDYYGYPTIGKLEDEAKLEDVPEVGFDDDDFEEA